MVLTLYLSFVYGIVYLLFEAIPISKFVHRGASRTVLISFSIRSLPAISRLECCRGWSRFLGTSDWRRSSCLCVCFLLQQSLHAQTPRAQGQDGTARRALEASYGGGSSFCRLFLLECVPYFLRLRVITLTVLNSSVGWTYYPSINPASPLLAVALMGFAILFMFLSIFNYLM